MKNLTNNDRKKLEESLATLNSIELPRTESMESETGSLTIGCTWNSLKIARFYLQEALEKGAAGLDPLTVDLVKHGYRNGESAVY